MSDIWISMREKKLTNTLTLMTDTLTRVTAERDALQENYTLLGEVCDQMIGGAVNMLDIARDADRLAAENERLREGIGRALGELEAGKPGDAESILEALNDA